ncbi:MAG: biopolymer transporter ExbD [Myxococcota bacterium]
MGAKLGGGSFTEINMTPLIDIVLVVLIIMMVNIPIQVEEMGVKLPSVTTNTPPPATKSEQLVIAMYEDGSIGLNRELMGEDTLFGEVTRRLRPMEKKIVFIDAFPTTNYGVVVDMMDLAKEAGAAKVAFAKMKPAGPAPATKVRQGAMARGVTLGSPAVVGAITEKKADESFQPLFPTVKACYNSVLAAAPQTSGRFILRITVGPQGEQLSEPEIISSTVESPELEACVLEKAPAIAYEPLGEQKTALIHYPMLFSPG